MSHTHHYKTSVYWTGNEGAGTAAYTAYSRNHTIRVEGKPDILGSSDPNFRGDASRYNPEEMFLASISTCHMLWYLHLCAVNGVVVTAYEDHAEGAMLESGQGGRFTEVTLLPMVTVQDASMIDKAIALHEKAHHSCYIAASVNFPVKHVPKTVAEH